MANPVFSKTVGSINFIFEKLTLKNNDIIFLVKCELPAKCSFFMSNINGNGWRILYTSLLSNDILNMESDLFRSLKEEGY